MSDQSETRFSSVFKELLDAVSSNAPLVLCFVSGDHVRVAMRNAEATWAIESLGSISGHAAEAASNVARNWNAVGGPPPEVSFASFTVAMLGATGGGESHTTIEQGGGE